MVSPRTDAYVRVLWIDGHTPPCPRRARDLDPDCRPAATAIALTIAGRRAWWLYRLITSGQPAPGRVDGVTRRLGAAVKGQLVEVFGQRKLLTWSVPGAAHFFVFWAFLILATVYVEAYGALFNPDFAIPVVGHWASWASSRTSSR